MKLKYNYPLITDSPIKGLEVMTFTEMVNIAANTYKDQEGPDKGLAPETMENLKKSVEIPGVQKMLFEKFEDIYIDLRDKEVREYLEWQLDAVNKDLCTLRKSSWRQKFSRAHWKERRKNRKEKQVLIEKLKVPEDKEIRFSKNEFYGFVLGAAVLFFVFVIQPLFTTPYEPVPPDPMRQLVDLKFDVFSNLEKQLGHFKVGEEITIFQKTFLEPVSTYLLDIPEVDDKGVNTGWTHTGVIFSGEKIKILGFEQTYVGDVHIFPTFYERTIAIHCRGKDGKKFYINPLELNMERVLRENGKTKPSPPGKLVSKNRS